MKLAIVALIIVMLCVEHVSARSVVSNGPGKGKKDEKKKEGKEDKDGHKEGHKKEGGHAHWGYKHGGVDWTGPKCQTNLRQSPVNIISTLAKKEGGKAPVFKYKPTKAKILNNGHVLQVEAETAGGLGSVEYNGNEYEVLQFHFHNPGEHKIDNKRYPLELHIVHRKKGSQGMNDLLVVGVNFESKAVMLGAGASFISSIKPKSGDFPSSGDPKDTKPIEKEIDLNTIKVLKNSDLYNYQGSLTTPTCDDTVTWFVAKTPEKISVAALRNFEKLFSKNAKFAGGRGNNRVIQTANTPGVEGSERKLFVVHTA